MLFFTVTESIMHAVHSLQSVGLETDNRFSVTAENTE